MDHPKLSKKPKTPSVAMLNQWGGAGGAGRRLTNWDALSDTQIPTVSPLLGSLKGEKELPGCLVGMPGS